MAGTVQRDKGSLLLWPAVMNRVRHQLLAGAAFTDNQNRAAGASGGLNSIIKFAHGVSCTHQPAKAGTDIARKMRRFALQRRYTLPGYRRAQTEIGAHQQNDPHMAQLVEQSVDVGGRRRILREHAVRAFLEQMKRSDHLLQRNCPLGERFAQTDDLAGVPFHVAFEQS